MANPQAENGHTDIANEILEHLWRVNLSPYETRVLLYLLRKTYGYHKKTDWITLSQFSKEVGIDRRLVHRTLQMLSSREMIVIDRDDRNHPSYGFQKNYEHWKPSSLRMTKAKLSSAQMSGCHPQGYPQKKILQKKMNILVAYSDSFNKFWEEYPTRNGKKAKKKEAFKEWQALKPEAELQGHMLEALKRQKEHFARMKKKGEFIPEFPDACRWIKHRRWEDEIPEEKPKIW